MEINLLYTQNIFIAIWSTHLKLVFITVEALFIADHQALYIFITEISYLWFKSCINGLFDIVIVMEPLAIKEGFLMVEEVYSFNARFGL